MSTGAVTGITVPEGATAIAYNVTVTNTAGAGFLEVAPPTMAPPQSSTINWSGGGQTLANAGIVRVFSNREVQVSCGGVGASTNFIIDVTGYWA